MAVFQERLARKGEKTRRVILAAFGMVCSVSLANCGHAPPVVSIAVQGNGGGTALSAARTVERQQTAIHGGMIAARVIEGLTTGPTLRLDDVAAAIGTADTPMFVSLARAGVPVISIDRRLDARVAFCVCGSSAPAALADRVALAMEILDTAIRHASRANGTPHHAEVVRVLESERFRSHWGDVRFGRAHLEF